MNKKQEVGYKGENLACRYLEQNNYNIIERNYRCKNGEIDIIAYDNNTQELVFLEVKTRTNFIYGIPSESVTIQKQAHIKSSIKYYLYIKNIINKFIRVDIIEIVYSKKNKNYKLNHIKQVI